MGHRISNKILPLTFAIILPLLAQPPAAGRGGPPPSPKAIAPIDLTGYWVSVITEDWRFRMVTPAPGDYQGVPMTLEALKIADAWDPAKDEASGDQCKSYGAPAFLRLPSHFYFSWQDDQTISIETDTGKQTRVFHFGNWNAPAGPATLQGDSSAQWEIQGPPPPEARAGNLEGDPQGNDGKHGSLKVTTSHLKPGYLRKNGVPYSENAVLTEYFDMVKEPSGDWIIATSIVTDPIYLREPFIVSTQLKKQVRNEGWKPTECSARW